LIATDLTNTYDAQHTDVAAWAGPVIRTLAELPGLLDGTGPALQISRQLPA
jgi:hypothetical protein